MEVFVNIFHSCLCIWVFIRNTLEVSFRKVVSLNVQKYLALAIFSPLAYSSHPSHNNLNHHHHHHHHRYHWFHDSLTHPHTTHGSDLIHSFQHKSSPSFNDHKVSNAIPFTHSPLLFTHHTYRTSTTTTSINNNDVYPVDNKKTGQKYPDLVHIVNTVKKNIL